MSIVRSLCLKKGQNPKKVENLRFRTSPPPDERTSNNTAFRTVLDTQNLEQNTFYKCCRGESYLLALDFRYSILKVHKIVLWRSYFLSGPAKICLKSDHSIQRKIVYLSNNWHIDRAERSWIFFTLVYATVSQHHANVFWLSFSVLYSPATKKCEKNV